MKNMEMSKLVNKLLDLRESNENLQDMGIWTNKEKNTVRVNLEYTYYDYDFLPLELQDLIDQYMYEWNYSFELEIYL